MKTILPTSALKHRILAKTADVFYRHGFSASGVDLLAKSVGLTKASLYHHFRNKNHLIESALEQHSLFHRTAYRTAWNRPGLTPRQQLTVLFDEMAVFFRQTDCYGCPFINAASEFKNRDHFVRIIARNHYDFVRANLEQFAAQAGINNPPEIAEKITIIIMGTYTGWYVGGLEKAAEHGKEMAETLIDRTLSL